MKWTITQLLRYHIEHVQGYRYEVPGPIIPRDKEDMHIYVNVDVIKSLYEGSLIDG